MRFLCALLLAGCAERGSIMSDWRAGTVVDRVDVAGVSVLKVRWVEPTIYRDDYPLSECFVRETREMQLDMRYGAEVWFRPRDCDLVPRSAAAR